MRFSEFAILFGIFILIFYASSTFLMSFQVKTDLPPEIQQAWNQSYAQIQQAHSVTQSGAQQGTGGTFDVLNVFQKAFGGVFYILLSLYNVFVSTPQAVFGGISYLARSFGIPDIITQTIIAIATVVIVLKVISIIIGREV
jgi:hypothetical protein